MKRFLTVVLLCAAFLPTVALATPHVLRYADGLEVTTLDPLTAQSAADQGLRQLTGAYLTRYGSGRPVPEIATVVPTQQNGGISADGVTIVWHLRHDVKWSDGAPLDANDVAFTVALIKNPATLTLDSHDFAVVEKVDVPDRFTAIFHLSRPYGSAIHSYFASDGYPILPAHLLRDGDFNKSTYNSLPVGAGPFRVVRFDRGDQVELERNPFYFRGRAKLDKIVFKIIPNTESTLTTLRAGDIDFAPQMTLANYVPLSQLPGITAEVLKGTRPAWLVLNTKQTVTADAAVRRALMQATDRPTILEKSYQNGGLLNQSILPPISPFWDPNLPLVKYDPKAAEATLDAGGWKRGPDGVRAKDGMRLEVDIVGGAGIAFVQQIVELLRAAWTPLGIDVEAKFYQSGTLFAPSEQGGIILGGRFNVALFSVGAINADALPAAFGCKLIPPAGGNYPRLCDEKLQVVLDKIDRTYSESELRPLYTQTQQMLDQLTPFIVLTDRNEYFIHRDTVVGLHILPYGPFDDFLNVDVTR